jgi:probable rRNA maturation factor
LKGVSFLSRCLLKPGTHKPSVVLELWRAGARRRRPRLPVSSRQIALAVGTTLAHENFSLSGIFCFIFVGKKFLKELNKQFRHVHRETDVISFSYMNLAIRHSEPKAKNPYDKTLRFAQSDGTMLRMTADVPLADIYISEDNAAENAGHFGESLKKELQRLVIHGTLHALGYTDYAPKAKKRMWARQERALLQTIQ